MITAIAGFYAALHLFTFQAGMDQIQFVIAQEDWSGKYYCSHPLKESPAS